MPQVRRWFEFDLDINVHGRRGVWIAFFITMVGGAIVYADKAADERSAFIRWRHQVREFWEGKNIWDIYMFPNPPIMPLSLTPLMSMPPVAGAVTWFIFKALLTVLTVVMCFRMVQPEGRKLAFWAEGLIIALSLRPILSDLHHGNINLLILFLIVATLAAWRKGYDVLAGLLLALAIAYKVTPALFIPYFMYRRSWRTVGATVLGLGIFLLIVPSIFLGPTFNGQCLAMWWHRILRPFVVSGVVGYQEINQSMVGVLMRLFTEGSEGKYGVQLDVNLVSWNRKTVSLGIKALSVIVVGLLAYFCRTKATDRKDTRLLGEFALVVLTMLFVSERSWKHHFVTLLLPYTYLVYRMTIARESRRVRGVLLGAMLLSAALISSTSTEIGGLFAHGQGHKYALAYGMFFWAAVVLYIATAWRVVVEGRRMAGPDDLNGAARHEVPSPHIKTAQTHAAIS